MRESVPSVVLTFVLRPAFIFASVAWAALLVIAPLVAAQAPSTRVEGGFLLAAYAIGGAICHQRPGRSFFLWGEQMPVCARCAGIYVAAAITAIVAAWVAPLKGRPATATTVGRRLSAVDGQRFSAASRSRLILGAAAVPVVLSLVYEWTTGHMPSHWARAVTGLPLGAVVAWLVLQEAAPRARAADQVN
jgi:hypothetical protein